MISSLALALAAMSPQGPTVTVGSLLREMTDLEPLTRRSNPWFDLRQASSYDRASDGGKDPFANGDAGQFIRKEGDEHVMADLKGPGAVVRVWSANPYGVIRFYFDGETTPRLQGKMAEMLSGRNPLFPNPFAYVASQGQSLYFPLPYAKSLKVTWDPAGEKGGGLYYVVGHRDYAPGTRVNTFTPQTVATEHKAMRGTAAALLNQPARLDGCPKEALVKPGGKTTIIHKRDGGEIRLFYVVVGSKDDESLPWTDPKRVHNLLRKVRVRMKFDGETTVDVPLGDFFGSATGITPYRSLPIEVRPDGTMLTRWPMPYRKTAEITLTNEGTEAVRLTTDAVSAARKWTPGSYLFHANWHGQTRSTRPMYHYTYVDAKGEGKVAGVSLQVTNPVPEWWGEGDEKVYVDGESWPRLFGTGSEDFFGYAWCDPTPFERPYHAQPPTMNVGNFGQTQNTRFFVLDPVTFQKSIRFDMEAWHWKETQCTYATTAFWYAAPGATGVVPPNEEELTLHEAPFPKPVPGAIEGEGLRWHVSGGVQEKQRGFPQLSSLAQLWWRNAPVGATADVSLPVAEGGRYEVVAKMGHARDYGRFTVQGMHDADTTPGTFDFYQPELEWKTVTLGTFTAKDGFLPLRFTVLPPNPAADPSNMLGADYFVLKKVG